MSVVSSAEKTIGWVASIRPGWASRTRSRTPGSRARCRRTWLCLPWRSAPPSEPAALGDDHAVGATVGDLELGGDGGVATRSRASRYFRHEPLHAPPEG